MTRPTADRSGSTSSPKAASSSSRPGWKASDRQTNESPPSCGATTKGTKREKGIWNAAAHGAQNDGPSHDDAPGDGEGGCHGRYEEPSVEDKITFFEEYQRDLEQETADVAERIRRLKEAEEGAAEPTVDA